MFECALWMNAAAFRR